MKEVKKLKHCLILILLLYKTPMAVIAGNCGTQGANQWGVVPDISKLKSHADYMDEELAKFQTSTKYLQFCHSKKKCYPNFGCEPSLGICRDCPMKIGGKTTSKDDCWVDGDCCPNETCRINCKLGQCKPCAEFKSRCKRNSDCCSRVCDKGVCAKFPCTRVFNECTEDSECCSQKCIKTTGKTNKKECAMVTGEREICKLEYSICKITHNGKSLTKNYRGGLKQGFYSCCKPFTCSGKVDKGKNVSVFFCKGNTKNADIIAGTFRCAEKNEACNSSGDCCRDYKCDESTKKCVIDNCADLNESCATSQCCNGFVCSILSGIKTCKECLGNGEHCDKENPCCSDLTCSGGTCVENSCSTVGKTCTSTDDCCTDTQSLFCDEENKCSVCTQKGSDCSKNINCCETNNLCLPDFSSSKRTLKCMEDYCLLENSLNCMFNERDLCCEDLGLSCRNGILLNGQQGKFCQKNCIGSGERITENLKNCCDKTQNVYKTNDGSRCLSEKPCYLADSQCTVDDDCCPFQDQKGNSVKAICAPTGSLDGPKKCRSCVPDGSKNSIETRCFYNDMCCSKECVNLADYKLLSPKHLPRENTSIGTCRGINKITHVETVFCSNKDKSIANNFYYPECKDVLYGKGSICSLNPQEQINFYQFYKIPLGKNGEIILSGSLYTSRVGDYGICLPCLAENSVCNQYSKCCKGTCMISGDGITLKCLTEKQCIQVNSPCENSKDCCGNSNSATICRHYFDKVTKNYNKFCGNCVSEKEKCFTDTDCCKDFVCGINSDGGAYYCVKPRIPECINPNGNCHDLIGEDKKLIKMKCCGDNFICLNGACRICTPKKSPCDLKTPCCQLGDKCFPNKSNTGFECKVKAECFVANSKCKSDLDCCDQDKTGSEKMICYLESGTLYGKCRACSIHNDICFGECCDSNDICKFESQGIYKKCQDKKGPFCIELQGLCGDADRTCCKGKFGQMKCLKSNTENRCFDCLESPKKEFQDSPEFECRSDNDCCYADHFCLFNSKGTQKICLPRDSCIDLFGKNCNSGQKCCKKYICDFDGICKDCILIGQPCDFKKKNCCGGNVCAINAKGDATICQPEGIDYCIELKGSCLGTNNIPTNCCPYENMQCNKGKCEICYRSEETIYTVNPKIPCCDPKLKIYLHTQGLYFQCQAKIPCLENLASCNSKSTEAYNCCAGDKIKFCHNGRCGTCFTNSIQCDKPADCCSNICDFDGGDKKVCKQDAGKGCVDLGQKCHLDGNKPECCQEQNPGTSTQLVCKNQLCVTCKINEKEICSADDDCCSGYCGWSNDGSMRVCENPDKKDKCFDKTNNCDEGTGTPKRNCCQGFHCFEKKCSDCLLEESECIDGASCCGKLICGLNSKGEKRCLKEAALCIDNTFPCVFKEHQMKCCGDNQMCYVESEGKGSCKACLSQKADCEPTKLDIVCCTGKCGVKGDGSGFSCIADNELACVNIEGVCDNNLKTCCKVTDKLVHCYIEEESQSGKCSTCLTDEKECSRDDECCTKICGWDELGRRRCGKTTVECINMPNGFCNIEKEPKIPCCKRTGENEIGLTCVKNSCEQCFDKENICKADTECCDGKCNWDDTGKIIKCHFNDGIAKDGDCVDPEPAILFKEKYCKKGLTCYPAKPEEPKAKICQECDDDGISCIPNGERKCCSGLCSFNENSQFICMKPESKIDCVKENKACLTLQGLPHCCSEFQCVGGLCVDCIPIGGEYDPLKSRKCCSGKPYWNTKTGVGMICFEEEGLCIEKGGQCSKEDVKIEGENLQILDKKCCQKDGIELTCYMNSCVEKCLEDEESCIPNDPNSKCCIGNCFPDETGNFVCRINGLCVTKDGKCVGDLFGKTDEEFDNAVKVNTCCKEFNCVNGACIPCSDENICKGNNDCCSKNCYWDKEGASLMCLKVNENRCIQDHGSCDDVTLDELYKKNCCPELFCYKGLLGSKCRSNCVLDGEACPVEGECCSGICVYNEKGERICGNVNQCIDPTKNPEVKCEIDDSSGSLKPDCCPDFRCSKKTKTCIKCTKEENDDCYIDSECCSENCYFQALGVSPKKCRPFDVPQCVEVTGICDIDEKKCCAGSLCHNKICVGCSIPEGEKCNEITGDEQCCTKKCVADGKGGHKCGLENECASDENLLCVKTQADLLKYDKKDGERLLCCESNGLVCYNGLCKKCLDDTKSCTILDPVSSAECCSKICDQDPLIETLRCLKVATECIPESGSCQIGPNSKRNCCEKLLCDSINKICTKCQIDGGSCENDTTCCSGSYCPNKKCEKIPICMGLKKSCNQIACCENEGLECISSENNKICMNCRSDSKPCSRHSDCCKGHCHYNSETQVKTCGLPKRHSDVPTITITNIDPPKEFEPDCGVKDSICSLTEFNCCPGFTCSDGKCSYANPECQKGGDDCTQKGCCPDYICLGNTCKSLNECVQANNACVLTKECCKGMECKGLSGSKTCVKPEFYLVFSGCSHEGEECKDNEIECCATMKCIKESVNDLEGICSNCVSENNECGIDDKCCGDMFCMWDLSGLHKKCTYKSTNPCIQIGGYCDGIERNCCIGNCDNGRCLQGCKEKKCCEDDECCSGYRCDKVKSTCILKDEVIQNSQTDSNSKTDGDDASVKLKETEDKNIPNPVIDQGLNGENKINEEINKIEGKGEGGSNNVGKKLHLSYKPNESTPKFRFKVKTVKYSNNSTSENNCLTVGALCKKSYDCCQGSDCVHDQLLGGKLCVTLEKAYSSILKKSRLSKKRRHNKKRNINNYSN